MRGWLAARLPPGSELAGRRKRAPGLRTALERAGRFLSLAALCASLLAGVAILLATRRYVDHALDSAAVLRTLGMRGCGGTALASWPAAGGCPDRYPRRQPGRLLGQQALVGVLGDWFGQALPAPGLRPMWVGMPSVSAWRSVLRCRRSCGSPGAAAAGVTPRTRCTGARRLAGVAGRRRAFVGLSSGRSRNRAWRAVSRWLCSPPWCADARRTADVPRTRAAPTTGGTAAFGVAALARYPQLTLLQLAGSSRDYAAAAACRGARRHHRDLADQPARGRPEPFPDQCATRGACVPRGAAGRATGAQFRSARDHARPPDSRQRGADRSESYTEMPAPQARWRRSQLGVRVFQAGGQPYPAGAVALAKT